MFAYLIGRVAGVTEDNLVLEVGQIGFNVKIPASLPSLLPFPPPREASTPRQIRPMQKPVRQPQKRSGGI